MAQRATSFKMLAKLINDDLRVMLESDVAKYMEDVLREHIYSDIYDVSQPGENKWLHHTTYRRRYGLPQRVRAYTNKRGNIVRVTSTATARNPIYDGSRWGAPGAFLNMLQEGNMGFLSQYTHYGYFPRPALENAQHEIETSGIILAMISRKFG